MPTRLKKATARSKRVAIRLTVLPETRRFIETFQRPFGATRGEVIAALVEASGLTPHRMKGHRPPKWS